MQLRSAPAVLLCLLLLAGCTRKPPLQQTVNAETPMALNLWRAKMNDSLPPEDWRWFDVVMQEYKFQLMLAGKISGSAAIDAAVRERIHGRAMGEVLREGLQAHLQRKTAERDDMKTAFARNEEKRALIRPGQDDLLRDLNFHQETLGQNLAKLETDLAAAQAALGRFENPAAR
jgi:hypothetical protein